MSRASLDILRAKTAGVETPAIYPVRGSAKAYFAVNQLSVQTIIQSLNIASIVDGGLGKTTGNLSSSFSSVAYSLDGRTNAYSTFVNVADAVGNGSASALEIIHFENSTALDTNYINLGAKGDLA